MPAVRGEDEDRPPHCVAVPEALACAACAALPVAVPLVFDMLDGAVRAGADNEPPVGLLAVLVLVVLDLVAA